MHNILSINARFIKVSPVIGEMLNMVEKNMEGSKRSYHNIGLRLTVFCSLFLYSIIFANITWKEDDLKIELTSGSCLPTSSLK